MTTEDQVPKKRVGRKLRAIYKILLKAYGPQHWWPGGTAFEVMVGAVLTQNTSWSNVERAIANLRRERLLTHSRLHSISTRRLALHIRPSGYFNIKARRLKNLTEFVQNAYAGSLRKMFADNPSVLRQKLLDVNGIGQETADSILLYAGGKPFFVVDAYTRRVFNRHGFIAADAPYHSFQKLFMENLRKSRLLYNEYHALIVRVGKEHCKRAKPLCDGCPLEPLIC